MSPHENDIRSILAAICLGPSALLKRPGALNPGKDLARSAVEMADLILEEIQRKTLEKEKSYHGV